MYFNLIFTIVTFISTVLYRKYRAINNMLFLYESFLVQLRRTYVKVRKYSHGITRRKKTNFDKHLF